MNRSERAVCIFVHLVRNAMKLRAEGFTYDEVDERLSSLKHWGNLKSGRLLNSPAGKRVVAFLVTM